MEISFSPEAETHLNQLASAKGKNPEQLVRETVNRMLDNQAAFVARVNKGLQHANRGEFVEHEVFRVREMAGNKPSWYRERPNFN
jgi:predicted transcriptional regulator